MIDWSARLPHPQPLNKLKERGASVDLQKFSCLWVGRRFSDEEASFRSPGLPLFTLAGGEGPIMPI